MELLIDSRFIVILYITPAVLELSHILSFRLWAEIAQLV
jgi:hypothetical protein